MVAANSDTLYISGFFDLTGGPVVLTIPDAKGRFHVLALLDAYTNVPFTVGTSFPLTYFDLLQPVPLQQDAQKVAMFRLESKSDFKWDACRKTRSNSVRWPNTRISS